MIRIFKKSVFVLLASLALFSCQKEEQPKIEYLEVNASNLNGNWELKSINDTQLEEGAYFYINFNRSGNEYTIWETMMAIPSAAHVTNGTFSIYTDPEIGAYIRGIDDVKQEWSDRYVIKDLTKTSMTWVGINNPDFIQKFERIDSVPLAL